MSLTIDSSYSSLLQSSVNAQLLANVAASSSASDPNSIGAITTAALTGSTSGSPTPGLTSLGSDLATLFKDLAANDTSAAQSDLTQLEKDLGVSTSSSGSTSTPLQQLFSSLSSSISSGDTTTAINTLASFFLQNGSSTGNVVNTTA